MNLAANLTRSAAAHPERVAIRMGDQTLDYSALDDASARVAGLLAARGLGPGSRVGIMLPNVPEFAVVYYGVLRAGGEEVGAAVVAKAGATVTPDQLRAHVKENVAAYKYPRRIWFVDALPKTSTGKIVKREIRLPAPDPRPAP